jgi:ribosomal protein S6
MKSSLSDKEREKLLESIKGWLKLASASQGGPVKVVKEESWGQKPLAYKIRREVAGFYHKMELEAGSIPADFEKRLQTQENILRHLLLRKK